MHIRSDYAKAYNRAITLLRIKEEGPADLERTQGLARQLDETQKQMRYDETKYLKNNIDRCVRARSAQVRWGGLASLW